MIDASELDGLVTFFASLHAMRADKVLMKAGLPARLIPGPREISPHCGVALQIRHADADEAARLLSEKRVQIEAIHRFCMSELAATLA